MLKGNFSHGWGHFREGFQLIVQPGLRLFVVLPLLLNVLLFGAMFAWLAQIFRGLTSSVMGWLPDWAWLQALDWLFWTLYGLVVLLMLAYGFVIIANLIAAPFYGYLAELTEKRLTGQSLESTNWSQIVRDVPRVLWREVQKLMYYLPRALALMIIGFIPVINVIVAVLWFGFSAWMMALQYVDYPADNRRVSFADLHRLLRETRLTALGFGLPVALGVMVPLVNLIIMPAAVCGGTAYWVREREKLRGLSGSR